MDLMQYCQPTQQSGGCPAGNWQCASGHCISESYFCDGSDEHGNAGWSADCPDGSDEIIETCCELGYSSYLGLCDEQTGIIDRSTPEPATDAPEPESDFFTFS